MTAPQAHTSPTKVVVEEQISQSTQLEEAIRRDRIVRARYAACPFTEGEFVSWKANELRKSYGENLVIRTICKSYSYMRTDKWPDNDEPKIITVQDLDKGSTYYNTTSDALVTRTTGTFSS